MKSLLSTLSVVTIISLCACSSGKEIGQSSNLSTKATESVNSVLWQQTAAEYEALCYQAFNAASARLTDEAIGNLSSSKPLAIVMDLDETVLDNSPYNGYLTLADQQYSSSSWKQWTDLSKAELVPGAKEFISTITDNGVFTLFFISNRKEEELEATILNLKNQGIYVESDFFLLRNEDSNFKIDRRQRVMANYEIVMLIGDNLADFDDAFEGELSLDERKKLTEEFRSQFGKKFIVLPNVMYGAWESSLKNEDAGAIQNPELKGKLKYIKSFNP